MKIVRLELNNFRPFSNVIVPEDGELPDGLFVIQGPNSAGKTSLIQGLLWCLLGEDVINIPRKKLVRRGETSCKVDMTFEVGGSLYRLVRKLTIKKRRTKAGEDDFNCNATLTQKDDRKFVPIKDGCAPVNREIERLLGISAENVTKTIFIRQKEVDSLAKAKPSDLRKIITDLFGLEEFESIKGKLDYSISDLQHKIGYLQKEMGRLDSEREERDNKIKELQTAKQELDKRNVEIKQLRETVKKLPKRVQINSIKQIDSEISSISNSLNNLSTQKEGIERNIDTRKERVTQATNAINQLNSKAKTVGNELQSMPEIQDLDGLQSLNENISTCKKQIKSLIQRAKVELDEGLDPTSNPVLVLQKLDEDAQQLIRFENTRNELSKRRQQMQTEKTRKETRSEFNGKSIQQIELSDNCPICNKPLNDKMGIVKRINHEVERDEEDVNKLESNMQEEKKKSDKLECKIQALNGKKNLHNNMKPVVEEHGKALENISNALKKLHVSSLKELLENFSVKSISELQIKRTQYETNLSYISGQIDEHQGIIDRENLEIEKLKNSLFPLETEIESLTKKIMGLQEQLKQTLKELRVKNIEDLLNRFTCESLDRMLAKEDVLTSSINEKVEELKKAKEASHKIERDVKTRRTRIKGLESKEKEKEVLDLRLKHTKFLKGEIDGFISTYVVERKLFGALRVVTNEYLQRFTNGRYQIETVRSTAGRVKDRIAYGLEIEFLDNIDGMVKSRDDLSGGDETALGLALRMSVSRLMARIRPFKTGAHKAPLITSLIMDEPLSSLDSERRSAIISSMVREKWFSQIFLVTHTEVTDGEYHIIEASQNAKDRELIYKPRQF